MNPLFLKPPLFLACLAPLAYYAWGAQAETLGANPIEAVTRGLGDWALNFLLITLAGSFFVDLANAVVARIFLALPYFQIAAQAAP